MIEKAMFMMMLGMLAAIIFWPPTTVRQLLKEDEWKGRVTICFLLLCQAGAFVGIVYSLYLLVT